MFPSTGAKMYAKVISVTIERMEDPPETENSEIYSQNKLKVKKKSFLHERWIKQRSTQNFKQMVSVITDESI